MSFERGFLTKPAVKRLIQRWDSEDEQQRIREMNEQIVDRYLRRIGTEADPFKVTPLGGGEERAR